MTRNEFRDTVYKAFIAYWTTNFPDVQYCFDNEAFNPPEIKVGAGEDPRWVRLSVKHTGRQRTTLARVGDRKFEHSATVKMQIYTVPNTGMKSSDELGQAFDDIFSADLGREDVFDGEGAYREIGQTEGWNMAVVSANFTYHEIR